jgi:hypothetical protein
VNSSSPEAKEAKKRKKTLFFSSISTLLFKKTFIEFLNKFRFFAYSLCLSVQLTRRVLDAKVLSKITPSSQEGWVRYF